MKKDTKKKIIHNTIFLVGLVILWVIFILLFPQIFLDIVQDKELTNSMLYAAIIITILVLYMIIQFLPDMIDKVWKELKELK